MIKNTFRIIPYVVIIFLRTTSWLFSCICYWWSQARSIPYIAISRWQRRRMWMEWKSAHVPKVSLPISTFLRLLAKASGDLPTIIHQPTLSTQWNQMKGTEQLSELSNTAQIARHATDLTFTTTNQRSPNENHHSPLIPLVPHPWENRNINSHTYCGYNTLTTP